MDIDGGLEIDGYGGRWCKLLFYCEGFQDTGLLPFYRDFRTFGGTVAPISFFFSFYEKRVGMEFSIFLNSVSDYEEIYEVRKRIRIVVIRICREKIYTFFFYFDIIDVQARTSVTRIHLKLENRLNPTRSGALINKDPCKSFPRLVRMRYIHSND